MRIISVRNINTTVESVRPKIDQKNRNKVKFIIIDVKKRKDKAIKEYEKKFTGASLKSLKVSKVEIKNAYSKVTKQQIAAIMMAKKRLEKSELTVKNQLKKIVLQIDGVKINKDFVPIQSIGCYIPGGAARYPSTVVMSVVPA